MCQERIDFDQPAGTKGEVDGDESGCFGRATCVVSKEHSGLRVKHVFFISKIGVKKDVASQSSVSQRSHGIL